MSAKSERALYGRLMSYVKPYWKVFALSVLGMVAASATEPLLPALLKPLLDRGFGAADSAWSPLTCATPPRNTPNAIRRCPPAWDPRPPTHP